MQRAELTADVELSNGSAGCRGQRSSWHGRQHEARVTPAAASGKSPGPYAAETSNGWLRVNESLYLHACEGRRLQQDDETYVTGSAPYCLKMLPSPFFSALALSAAPESMASASNAAAWVGPAQVNGEHERVYSRELSDFEGG